ncbi:platelet glycoprotein 4-like isoform X2 [Candoia aspera]
MSVGPENDTVTIVNLAVVVAPVVFPNEHFQAMMDILITSSKSKFLQTRTVKEILWGYEDPFLKIVPISSIDKVVGVFYPYNETLDGPYRIYSGKDDIRKKGIIHSYKNNSTVEYWPSYCGMVNGTDGSSFAPFVSKSDVLYFFSSDICRSIHATYDSEQTVKDILLYRFMIPPSAFASPLSNPDSTCFCLDKKTTQNCTLNGALDISSCKEEKPVIISLPHFLHGSKTLFQFVEGMKPNVEEHTTFLDVEPNTGFVLHFAKKLQMSLLVKPNAKITPLKKIKDEFVFPILWLNETAIISDEKAGVFRSEVIGKIELLHLIQTLLIAIGSVMFLGFLIAFFICRRKSPK